MLNSVVDWVKKNKVLAIVLAIGLFLVMRQRGNTAVLALPAVENFSTCLQRKQIYLNSCDPDQPSNHADVNIEKRWGKMYIKINANLPYAKGGVLHTMYGAYQCFLVDSRNKRSINLGTLVRHGDHWYKLALGLLGQYDNYDRIDVYHQVEDYAPKRVLTGSITGQQCSSL